VNWKPLFESVSYPFEIVCPDGFVRHFPYLNEQDAQSDARIASESRCQFFERVNRLEEALGACRGGLHSVRKRETE